MQSSPVHLRGLREGSPLPAEMAPPRVLLLPAWGALVPGESGRANCPVLMPTAPGASLQCAPPTSRRLPQDEGGRQAGAGFSSQTHLYTPILRRLPESAAGACLAVAAVLLGTRQKPLCAESQPERTPGRALLVSCLTPPSALPCPLGCHKTLSPGPGAMGDAQVLSRLFTVEGFGHSCVCQEPRMTPEPPIC